jgi:pyruvate, water dikinase
VVSTDVFAGDAENPATDGMRVGLTDLATQAFRGRRTPLPDLDERIASFREVLQANNAALGHVARIQQALAGEIEPTAADARALVTGVTVQTFRMILNLNRLTGNRCRAIGPVFERIKAAVQQRTEVRPMLEPLGHVVPLSAVSAAHAEQVGQKSANLGAAMALLGDHVPPGFATTVEAYRAFMTESGLAQEAARLVDGLDSGDVEGCFRTSAQITGLVESAPVPAAVAAAIEQATAALGRGDLRLAVRSSALQEGGLEMSFAGQYRSLLNVAPQGVVDAFRRVVASKYSPQAITYRLSRGFTDDEVAMCCCVVRMVDATAAGVLYSAYQCGETTMTLVQAVRGLGLSAVDGSAEPDSYVIDGRRRAVVATKLGHQATLLRMAAGEGTEKLRVGASAADRAILTEKQALELADKAWRLERALGMPIDMEWAIARDGSVFVLQVRPQPTHGEDARPPRPRLQDVPALIEGGSRASGGAGCGLVCQVETDLDILRCPTGSVVVTSEANPRLAVLLPRAAAIVADLGEVTGHLATVARELKVPALFATRRATEVLRNGETVTVDADATVVYAGRIEQVLAAAARTAPVLKPNPNRDRLASVADLIVPLTLRDRLASGYSIKRCRTLHDIIRFCHQATVEAMFDLGDRALRKREPLRRLVSAVPIDCRLFDLGGGFREGMGPGDVTIDDVACVPMRALWRGMTDPRLLWSTTRPVSLKGFMSAVVNYNFDQDQRMRPMGEPSYAFITREYLNLNSRIGYHFSTVDARIGDLVESNYASFRFVGGSTGVDQRSRRATLIQRLLAARGFETDCRADLVNARVRHRPAAEMEEAAFLVGMLMGYVNHLDMALTSDAVMRAYEEAFLAGDYAFKRRDDHA